MSSVPRYHQQVQDDRHEKYANKAGDAEIVAKSIRLSARHYWGRLFILSPTGSYLSFLRISYEP
jgi:hypothetical protein